MILVVDMNSKINSLGFYEFVLPIVSVLEDKRKVRVVHYSELAELDLAEFDRIVLSGNALKDRDYLNNAEKFNWVKRYNGPVLGICAGMQSIGLAFGSSLSKCQEIGLVEIKTTKENPLFESTFKAYALHEHALQPSAEFEVLAESAECVQAIKHRTMSIFGVLFHPEVRNTKIIERFGALHG